MQNLERSDGKKENMGQKTTDAMVQSQHGCLIVRVCQKHMSKHSRVCSWHRMDIGSGTFKRAFVTHRIAVTTAVKQKRYKRLIVTEEKEKKC